MPPEAPPQDPYALLDCLDESLLLIGPDGLLEHANPSALRLLGRPSEVQPGPLSAGTLLQHPQLDRVILPALHDRQRLQPEQPLVIERADRQQLLRWQLIPTPAGALVSLREANDQARADHELVFQATHALRTPITGMQMALSLLKEHLRFPTASREADLAGTLQEEMRRLGQLISDLLDYARHQSGRQPLQPDRCQLDVLAQESALRFQERAQNSGIQLLTEIQTDLPPLQLDGTQIGRVLDCLLDNALKQTGTGGSISLQACRDQEQILLMVEDTGTGIPADQQQRIFEPFVQFGANRTGSGLGLALSQSIIRHHGGTLEVESVPGQGSLFRIRLPIP